MLEGNLLVRASAGTGKTFALATRYLRLMLLDKVEPSRIVALTFSRAAAQEIYVKILDRLRKAAESAEGAAAESAEVCRGLGISRAWSAADFASLLRRLLDTQHLGTIATLDSFILRMVRNFPIEMGFQHEVEVLDAAAEGEAVRDAVHSILQSAGDAAGFIDVFAAARDGNLPRVFEDKIKSMLNVWRKFCMLRPECRGWTAESMLDALGIPREGECPGLSAVGTEGRYNPAATFIKHAESYDGKTAIFPKNKAGDMARFFARNPQATEFSWATGKGDVRRFDYGAAGAAAIRAAVVHMFNVRVRRVLKQVEARIAFAGFVEDAYNGGFRRKGRLAFSDFTRLSAAKEGSEKALAIENLEYRFDGKFDHWALDEFQDTSELQWNCLKPLVEEAASSGGGRTVMAVGDLKQSIYTWRGGNDAPFKEMMSWAAFNDASMGKIEDLATSHRYGRNICGFINAVFGPDNLQSPVLPACRAGAIRRWLSGDCWKVHRPATADGGPEAGDYVKVLGVPDPDGKADVHALMPALVDELRRVWEARKAGGGTESIGVLVRTNDDGGEIAERLRREGIPVVWEGVSAVSDVPAVNALVDLLRLSEHPGDTFAWASASRLFPVCSTLFPHLQGGGLSAARVSQAVAAGLSRRGLSRTLQEYCSALSGDGAGLDPLSKLRLREMVGVAVAYEQRSAGRFSVDGFETFLAASSKREQGTSPDVVRILTIHRSKGLTLDRVFVPLAEGAKKWLADPGGQGLLCGAGWVLPHMQEDEAALNPETEKAWNVTADECLLANIRTYYVALTRARRAVYVVQPLAKGDPAKPFFRDVVAAAAAAAGFAERDAECGRKVLLELGAEPEFKPKHGAGGDGARAARRPWRHDTPAEPVERVSPSSYGVFAAHGLPASGLFSQDAGEAARKGVEAHGRYEAVEWADGAELAAMPPAFRAAFAKPDPAASVWREKSYEIYRPRGGGGGEWETGRFDRVVFSGEGSERAAAIYDFKTNAPLPGEQAAAFGLRMRRTYGPQMKAYRAALSSLTGLPADRIRAVLLLQSTESAVEC